MRRIAAALCAAFLMIALCSCRDDGYLTLRHANAFEADDTGEAAADAADVQIRSHDVAYPETVYVTDTGEKYHVAGCPYLSSSSREIGLADAEAQGYRPCTYCFK